MSSLQLKVILRDEQHKRNPFNLVPLSALYLKWKWIHLKDSHCFTLLDKFKHLFIFSKIIQYVLWHDARLTDVCPHVSFHLTACGLLSGLNWFVRLMEVFTRKGGDVSFLLLLCLLPLYICMLHAAVYVSPHTFTMSWNDTHYLRLWAPLGCAEAAPKHYIFKYMNNFQLKMIASN